MKEQMTFFKNWALTVICFFIINGLASAQSKTTENKSNSKKAQTQGSSKWKKITPIAYTSIEEVVTKNKTITKYYELSKAKPVSFEVTGPAKIKIFLRLGFSCDMKGKVNYRLCIRDNRKIKNTYQICATNSTRSVFKNIKKLTPSIANFIIIEIPAEKHQYEIYPLDKNTSRLFCKVMVYQEK